MRPGSPLHVFRFGEDDRMYVHGEEVVLACDAEGLRSALLAIVNHDGHADEYPDSYETGCRAMASIAKSALEHEEEGSNMTLVDSKGDPIPGSDDTRPPLPNDSVTGWSVWKDTSVPSYVWCSEAVRGRRRLFVRVRTEEDARHYAVRNLEYLHD